MPPSGHRRASALSYRPDATVQNERDLCVIRGHNDAPAVLEAVGMTGETTPVAAHGSPGTAAACGDTEIMEWSEPG
jgi:hypothetical protein